MIRTQIHRTGEGFTLIELTVVLFIIAVVLGLVVPRLMDLTGVELRSDTQRLSSTIRYVYSRAVFSKTASYRIKFDLKKNEYWVEKCIPSLDTNTCEWKYDNDVLGKPERLANGIRFEDIMVGTVTVSADATDVAIQFSPQGYMPYTIIHIEDDRKDVYSLEVNPFTGRVMIYDRYIEPEKS
ncbi:MAG: prepilin-type N-terminal cleavage/methylation domain-containing protein [Deltaproteobacteria bacterium]|nr:prepilin-type N-terminal cleavage/methylation domain-containing protein [Deltaproteobacteria bacterium]MCL5276866.1 prepilin-type N-terminal cleavage/methylation domain-containing protein [Deltaproteobacteria bacterium]